MPRVRTKPSVEPRPLSEMEADATKWLLSLSPQKAGHFLSSLRRQASDWNAEGRHTMDAPLSPRQFEHLLAAYRNHLLSEEYRVQREAELLAKAYKVAEILGRRRGLWSGPSLN